MLKSGVMGLPAPSLGGGIHTGVGPVRQADPRQAHAEFLTGAIQHNGESRWTRSLCERLDRGG